MRQPCLPEEGQGEGTASAHPAAFSACCAAWLLQPFLHPASSGLFPHPGPFPKGDASAAGPLLASRTLTSTQFCTLHGSNCQSFADTLLAFSAPVSLQAGQSYFLALTSLPNDVQSQAYFIKGLDSLAVQDSNGAALPGQTVAVPAVVAVPEPGTVALLGLAVMGLGAARRRVG